MNLDQRFAVSIHVLTLLAASSGPLTSSQIAASVDTHPVVIRRIMANLRQHRMVESRPGARGGWRLLLPPQEISLCQVYHTIEQEGLLGLHNHPNPHCVIGGQIIPTLERVFASAQSALEEALCQVTIQDILEDVLHVNQPQDKSVIHLFNYFRN
jgi:Rrf2 family protein